MTPFGWAVVAGAAHLLIVAAGAWLVVFDEWRQRRADQWWRS